MTSSVLIHHTGGNRKIKVIVEQLCKEKLPGGDTAEWWEEISEFPLDYAGSHTSEIYVHDTQRIRIEEKEENL